ncbi:MAG: beta-ketoacyl-ACP synthase II [Candidatus Riflebacteria bacterium]|nr:beta-ketoacyl-ACP synthase II [Candidatus Riflebacteria bacterium]
MQPRRVVVTGLGVVAPNGIGAEETWKALLNGQSGIKEITSFDTRDYRVKIAGEVSGWDVTRYMEESEARRLDRACQFAVVAADEACRQARIGREFRNGYDPDRVGVLVSSGIGGILTLEEQALTCVEKGARRVSPFMIPRLIINLIPGNIAIRHDLRGPNFALVTACATGAHSIGEAFRQIRWGYADLVLAGGAEGAITPLTVAGFQNMKALSTRNELVGAASSPFDRDRDGFVIAEGSVCLILEELASAIRRNVRIFAEIVGYGASADAHHITAPKEGGEGLVRAARHAIEEAGIRPDDIGYVNAHGTSTPYNDKHETLALKTVFGERAYQVPISSTKSMVGHLLGGAGAIGAFACVMTLQEGKIHPTTNLKTPDPECDLDYVPNECRTATVNFAIANSMGFGGQNASLVFKKFEGH